MLALGTEAPNFSLPDTVSGDTVTLADMAGDAGTLVMFICNHCPYVQHIREGLASFGRDYENSPIGIVAISSNDVESYPEDSPEAMRAEALRYGYTFPYLFDEDQTVAAAYTAMCTPDFFLFDADLRLVYRGRFGESRPGSGIPVTGADLRAAMDALIESRPISEDQIPSMGCSIKWRAGNVPAYFAS